jgi:hypothetical protein
MSGDLPIQGLMQQRNARAHSGEYLEVLGKQAAARWSAGEHKTLTAAVTETVKQAQLSPEQVKRVIEFANTSAYLEEFKKEGGTHHVVDFPGGPADPSEILKDLNDGGGGTVFDRGTGDYESPPAEHKISSSKAETELFQLLAKEGSAELPFANPHGEVIELKDKLAGAADHLQSQISGLEVMYADLADRVYHQVKQAALTGVSLGEVMQAWQTVAPSEDHIKVAFTLITPRLLRDGVFHGIEQMTASVDKTAGARVVNHEHPLVVEFGDFCEALSKLAELREARAEVRTHLSSLNNYLKTADGGALGGVWNAAGRAGEALRPLGRAVGGNVGGTIAAAAPRTALVGAGLVAGNELNQHVENSPGHAASAARWAKHKVLQQVPGTRDHNEHLWRIQNGQ